MKPTRTRLSFELLVAEVGSSQAETAPAAAALMKVAAAYVRVVQSVRKRD